MPRAEQLFDMRVAAHEMMRYHIRRIAEGHKRFDRHACSTCFGQTIKCVCGLYVCIICMNKYEITHRHRVNE